MARSSSRPGGVSRRLSRRRRPGARACASSGPRGVPRPRRTDGLLELRARGRRHFPCDSGSGLNSMSQLHWMLAVKGTSDSLTLKCLNFGFVILHNPRGPCQEQGPDPCVCFRNQRGKKKTLIGDLAGPCQSHMYASEDAKRTLAHATSNHKDSDRELTRIRTVIHSVTTAEHSNSAID